MQGLEAINFSGYDWLLGQKVPTAADAYSPYKRPMPPLVAKPLVVTDDIPWINERGLGLNRPFAR